MAQDIPSEISDAGLEDWYSSLNDINQVKVKRYIQCIDTSSTQAFLVDLMSRTSEDHNYKLSVLAGQFALTKELSDYDRFKVTEAYIEGLFGAEDNENLKKYCCDNLDLFPSIRDQFLKDNGGVLPKNISCRNRLIDVMVGAESDYDGAYDALDEFVSIGILDKDELEYRKQSLKIHRMQKAFDNIFMYRPKE